MYEKRSSDCENKDAYSKVLLCASSKHATLYLPSQAIAPRLENGQHYYVEPTSQEPFSRKKVLSRFTSSDDYSFGPEEGGDWQENCQRVWQLQGNCQSTYREGNCHCQSKLQEEAVVVCWKETRYAVILTLTSTLSWTFSIGEGRGVWELSPQSVHLETWKTCLLAHITQCNVTIKFDRMQCNEGMKNKVNQMHCMVFKINWLSHVFVA